MKCSNLTPSKVGITIVKGEKKEYPSMTVRTKKSKKTVGLNKCYKKGAVQIKKELALCGRRDLLELALNKYAKCLKSFKKGKVQKMTERRVLALKAKKAADAEGTD